jgi:hypothetical protein
MFCRQPLHGAHGFTVCCTLVDVETVLPASAAREKDYVMPIFLICQAIEIVANCAAMVYPSPNSVIARCSAQGQHSMDLLQWPVADDPQLVDGRTAPHQNSAPPRAFSGCLKSRRPARPRAARRPCCDYAFASNG